MSFSYVTEMYDDLSAESLEMVVRSSIKKINDNKKSRSGARLSRNLMIATVIRKAKTVMVASQKIQSPPRIEEEDMDVQHNDSTTEESPVECTPSDSIIDSEPVVEENARVVSEEDSTSSTPTLLSTPSSPRKRRSFEMDTNDCSDSVTEEVKESKSQRLNSDHHVPTVQMDVDSSPSPLSAQILPGSLNLSSVTCGHSYPMTSLQGPYILASWPKTGSGKDSRPATLLLVPYSSISFTPNFQQLCCPKTLTKTTDLTCSTSGNSHLRSVDLPLIPASS